MPKKLKTIESSPVIKQPTDLFSKEANMVGKNENNLSDCDSDSGPSDWAEKGFCQKLFIKFKYSSLFLLHKDTKLRRFLLKLSESPEILEDFKQFEVQNHMLKDQDEDF